MFVIKRSKLNIRSLEERIKTTLRKFHVKVGYFVEYVTHGHVERPSFGM